MNWENIARKGEEASHYSVGQPSPNWQADCLPLLREMFPTGEADDLNMVLFSTSGVHGTYTQIEDVEASLLAGDGEFDSVTFLVIHPRIVALKYGNCYPKTQKDIDYLKKLRESSWLALAEVGRPAVKGKSR